MTATTQAAVAAPRRRRRGPSGHTIAVYVACTLVSLVFVAPFAWMVLSSLKSTGEIYEFPPSILPQEWRWSNYSEAWNALPFDRFFLNSLIVSGVSTAGAVLTSSMAGYAFARLRFPGRDKIFLGYLATMMIPFPVLMVPLYIIMRSLSLVDSLASLILPAMFTAWGTFLMRQFIIGLPTELEEAARVDGAGFGRIYWQIVLPLITPVIATLGIFTFLWTWNEFLWPLIMINTMENKTLPVGLLAFQTLNPGRTPWHLIMAASTLSVLPLLLMFIVGQRYYVRGIAMTGVKG
ncbi:carbohydrate ABC transporter permease [Jiangella alkaliphila]|uniref:Carbohydrate ABC transporter membrane protein 2, CUT1 family n=1 Tax=Jiangella alkaliphila TaxID=419479 RepID=A0A1H2LW32_9ACTN|nr:carbohydrate ABC transporter permease [Jiangella alkaliphila]SDU85220.1 carbohydrate ABC transporter membrane protein 2, CUT1 family [Jiangella alkaliphila]